MAHPTPQQGPDLATKDLAAAPQTAAHRLPAVRTSPEAPKPTQEKSRRKPWLWAGGLLLAAGVALALVFQPWTSGAALVTTEIVALSPVTRLLAVNGRIAASHSVDVRALVGGSLEALLVAEGDTVTEGAALARINDEAQQAVLRQALAGRDTALVAQAQARDAFGRAEALGSLVARTSLEAAARAVQTAAQDVARSTALVDQAQAQLDRFTLLAPMSGTILTLNVETGQSIDLSTPLMTIADLRQLVVETDVDEAYATQVRTGLTAVLQLTGEATQRPGRVSFVSQRVDAATGGLAVKLSFDEPVSAPIGLTVTTNIIVDSREAAITVPRAAMPTDTSVFVMVEGIARTRPVSVIDWPAERLIVTDGLAVGDVLILDATGLSDGQTVRVAAP